MCMQEYDMLYMINLYMVGIIKLINAPTYTHNIIFVE